jgi:hypothetical protein
MIELIAGALLLLPAAIVVGRIARCPLVRTLSISANCWAESEAARKNG